MVDSMKNIELDILNALLNEDRAISFKELSHVVPVSIKTLQNKMNILKKESAKYGFSIYSAQGQGHRLIVENQTLFNAYIEGLKKQDSQIDTPEKRQKFILKYLISHDEYITINDLASDLYISNSSISLDLKKIKKMVQKYDLNLVSSPAKGIKIQGQEKNKRMCLKALNDDHSLYAQDNIYEIVKQVILPICDESHLSLSDLGMQNLAVDLLIASQRIRNNQYIDMQTYSSVNPFSDEEVKIATHITHKAEEYFKVDFPRGEVYYLLQHLLGNQYLSSYTLSEDNEKYKEAYILYNKILKNIFNHTNIDFFEDLTLRNEIILHLIPFISRIRHNTMIENPLDQEIQSRYVYAFELASIGLSVVEDIFQVKITSDEISYFALYFVMALERIEEKKPMYSFLIVCGSGKATSQLLMFQFKRYFSEYIKSISTIEYHHLNRVDLDDIDFVISTIPISEHICDKPIIQINDLLKMNDINKIERLMKQKKSSLKGVIRKELFFTDEIKGSTSKECIQSIVENISRKMTLPQGFLDKVLEREKMFATDIAHFISIPHPITSITTESFVSVTVLDKPIIWSKQEVQIVFMISISKEDHNELADFFDSLTAFINDREKVNAVLQSKSYTKLIEAMEQDMVS